MRRVWGKKLKTAALLAVGVFGYTVHADQVQLANGDTLTGEVIAQTEQGVILKHPALGTLAIGADRVKAVTIGDVPTTADKPTAPAAAQAKPATKPTAKPATPLEKAKADALKKQAQAAAKDQHATTLDWFLAEWKSKLTLGINGAGGNTDRQNYIVKLDTKFEDGRDRWTANTRWFYGVANSNVTQNQFETNLTKDWLKEDSPWFFFLKGQYRYDAKRNWENRTSAFGGGGYTLAKTDDIELNTRLGFGGTYEYGDINEFTPEAMFGGSVVQWQVNERAAIAGEATYYPSLEDGSNFRVETKLEWLYKLDMAKGLSLKVGVENEYDSSTPNDAGNNDVNYYGALVLSF